MNNAAAGITNPNRRPELSLFIKLSKSEIAMIQPPRTNPCTVVAESGT